VPRNPHHDNNKKNLYYTLGGLGVVSLIGAAGYYWYTSTQKTIKLLLCGAPGSGKGTQCERLIEKYHVVHISTGDLLREAGNNRTELGLKAKNFMETGQLVPDDLVIGIVEQRLNQPDVKKYGWILDGFPRTEPQARALSKIGADPKNIIVLDVPDAEIEKRITGRRMDPVTNKIYHIVSHPPPEEIKSRVIIRPDDDAVKLKTRLVAYHQNINFILDYYKQMPSKPSMVRLNGVKPPNEIFTEIEKELRK